ncbi:MAG: hypothetical protein COA70_04495 [Planctomycetota bacterium]|nr:MAG: hypothetical protein COA70_04495 [Planctomycetota bacterium]
MDSSAGKIPPGIWAIGSDLKDLPDTEAFVQSSTLAVAITMRRPQSESGHALQCLRQMTSQKSFVAVHGHADLALAANAQAVIVGVRSLSMAIYRERFPSLLLGVSTHEQKEVEQALSQGADFLIFGPIWETPEKVGVMHPKGLKTLAQICKISSIPVIAIGGIGAGSQVQACQEAGAYGVAVLRAARNRATMAELADAFKAERL